MNSTRHATQPKKVALGIDDFKMIIDGNYAFVDKTLFINEFFQAGAYVTLAPRPRRFGKTMNLSMLRYFCEKIEGAERPNAYLFEGLKVSQHSETMAHQGQYPVIFLTFKDIKVPTWELCYEKLCRAITAEFDRHKYILSSLNEYQRKDFTAVLDGSASKAVFEESLKNLSMYLNQYHKKQVIVLIDEYDTPVHEAVVIDRSKKAEEKQYYNNIIYFIRNFMCAGLKGNVNLYKGFVTGILQVAKESIFSGMNNLDVCSLVAMGAAEKIKQGQTDNVLFTDKFGLQEEEIVDIFQQAGVPLNIDKVRHWYNGYSSGPFRVYNPWSIVSYLRHEVYRLYWINTSDNKLPRTLAAQAPAEVRAEIEQLGNGGMVRKTINESISFLDIDTQENVLWSFLLFSGYLTFQMPAQQDNALDFYLVVPNQEIKDFYKTIIESWFDVDQAQETFDPLLSKLVSGNIKEFKPNFEDFVMRCFSYLDVKKRSPESFYQAFILGLLSGLDATHEIKSNRESGTGRYDVMIVPRDSKGIGIIIELKRRIPDEEPDLKATAARALRQIERKKYEVELRERGIKDIRKLAIAIDGKEALVVEG